MSITQLNQIYQDRKGFPRGAMQGALMCRFLSHQGTEYTLSGLFPAASADSSEHVSLANGREISVENGCIFYFSSRSTHQFFSVINNQ